MINLFTTSQSNTFSNSVSRTWVSLWRCGPLKVNVVSSANWLKSNSDDELHMSLMYKRNSKGPRVEPWGTPMLTVLVIDFELLILTK